MKSNQILEIAAWVFWRVNQENNEGINTKNWQNGIERYGNIIIIQGAVIKAGKNRKKHYNVSRRK